VTDELVEELGYYVLVVVVTRGLLCKTFCHLGSEVVVQEFPKVGIFIVLISLFSFDQKLS
jgi:hypothetical protein